MIFHFPLMELIEIKLTGGEETCGSVITN